MVADLAQLHEDVNDRHVVACGELFLGRRERHEFVVKQTLTFAELAFYDVLIFLWHLLFNVDFEAT